MSMASVAKNNKPKSSNRRRVNDIKICSEQDLVEVFSSASDARLPSIEINSIPSDLD